MFWIQLSVVTLVQAVAAMSILALPQVISVIAESVDAGSRIVGLQTSFIFVSGIVTAFLGGTVVNLLGPGRTSQACMVAVAAAMAISAAGSTEGFLLAGLMLGLAYGLSHPPGTSIVNYVAPPHRRTLGIGIRQTAVPLGGAAAGLALPAIALLSGWRLAFIFVAFMAVLAAALVQPFENRWRRSGGARQTSLRGIAGDIRETFSKPNFFRFSLISIVYGAAQFTVAPFSILFYQHDLGFALAEAGFLSATIHGSAILSRLFWSWLADRTGKPRAVLLFVTGLMIVSAASLFLLTPETHYFLIFGHALLLGTSILGWNGVFMAEIVRDSPQRQVAQITGIMVAIFAIGASIGPLAFMQIFLMSGSFAAAFLALGILLFVPLATLLTLK